MDENQRPEISYNITTAIPLAYLESTNYILQKTQIDITTV
jgi:hypothetical protein